MAGKPDNKYSPEFKKKAVEKYLNGELGSMAYASRQLGRKEVKMSIKRGTSGKYLL